MISPAPHALPARRRPVFRAARPLAAAAAALGLAACARGGIPAGDYAGARVEPPKAAAGFTLVGTDGAPAPLLAPGVPLTLLFFGYTHCPDECPLALAHLAKARHALALAQRRAERIVFVSVDPARDTPAVVRRYVDGFGAGIVGLTGTRAQLAPVWAAYGVAVDPKTREVGHGDAIYAIDAARDIVLIYAQPTPADLAADARKIIG